MSYGGLFTFNGQYGVELNNSVLQEQSAPTCSDNGMGTVDNPCYNITPSTSTSTATSTPTNTPVATPTNTPMPTSTTSQSNSSNGDGGMSPAAEDQFINLDCQTTVSRFGITLTFLNLCDHQTALHSVNAANLPGPPPDGTSLLIGLDVVVLNQDQVIRSLPNGAGIQVDFPLRAGAQDQITVLYWDDEDSQWVEVSQPIDSDEISDVLSTDATDELYHILTADGNLYKILATERTGTFVLVKK